MRYDEWWFVNREKKYRGFLKLLQPATRQAVMTIEAQKDMGKTWLLSKMETYCQQENIPVTYIDFSNPRQVHRIQDVLSFIRLLRDNFKLDSTFNQLNQTINRVTNAQQEGASKLDSLREKIESYMLLDDIRQIAFKLQFKYDNLAGDTLRAKVRSLVQYCEQAQLLSRLIEVCMELRPFRDWQPEKEIVAKLYTMVSEVVLGETAPNEQIIDNNGILRVDTQIERQHLEGQLTTAFFACLEPLLAEEKKVVFLFDALESAPNEAFVWIYNELLTRVRDGQMQEALVIMSGRTIADLTDLDMKPYLVQTDLKPFSEDYIREYLVERRKISGLDIRTITITSGGVPGELAIMADRAMATVDDDDDFFSDL